MWKIFRFFKSKNKLSLNTYSIRRIHTASWNYTIYFIGLFSFKDVIQLFHSIFPMCLDVQLWTTRLVVTKLCELLNWPFSSPCNVTKQTRSQDLVIQDLGRGKPNLLRKSRTALTIENILRKNPYNFDHFEFEGWKRSSTWQRTLEKWKKISQS